MVRQIKSKTFLPAVCSPLLLVWTPYSFQTLFGANAAWPPGSLFPIPGAKVTVRFGDPVKVDATKDVTEVIVRVPVFARLVTCCFHTSLFCGETCHVRYKRKPGSCSRRRL